MISWYVCSYHQDLNLRVREESTNFLQYVCIALCGVIESWRINEEDSVTPQFEWCSSLYHAGAGL